MGFVLDRRRVAVLGLAAGLAVAGGIWFFHPDRMLDRAWNGLVGAVEARRAAALRGHLAEDYSDRWGYTRDALAADARFAFQHFEALRVLPSAVEVERRGDRAVITAVIRLEARGSQEAASARSRVNALSGPFRLEWRREPGFPGAWKLVTFDHPELDLNGFRRRWGADF